MINIKYFNTIDTRLDNFISHYWIASNSKVNDRDSKLLPTNHAELLINLSGSFNYIIDDNIYHSSPIHIHGIRQHTVSVIPRGITNTIGIAFKPCGLYFLIQDELSAYVNQIKSYHLNNYDDTLYQKLKNAYSNNDVMQCITLVENALLNYITCTENDLTESKLVDGYIKDMNTDVSWYCNYHNISTRKFERLFKKYIGLSPIKYKNLSRFENLSRDLLYRHEILDMSDLTYKFNYYDQSHFINQFKKYTGDTPISFINKGESTKLMFVISNDM